jgi:hypothetical protein
MAYTRIGPNELNCDCLAGCERRPCRHIDQLVPEVKTDTRTVEDDTSLSLNDKVIISVSSILFEKAKSKTYA